MVVVDLVVVDRMVVDLVVVVRIPSLNQQRDREIPTDELNQHVFSILPPTLFAEKLYATRGHESKSFADAPVHYFAGAEIPHKRWSSVRFWPNRRGNTAILDLYIVVDSRFQPFAEQVEQIVAPIGKVASTRNL